jgi:hypothetical protein
LTDATVGSSVVLTLEQFRVLQLEHLRYLVERHGSALRAAAREPTHARELATLNAAEQRLELASPRSAAFEARVRAALTEVLRGRRRAIQRK